MILDKGICSVFRKKDITSPGGMPTFQYALLFQSWYGELGFETKRHSETGDRQDVRVDARLRIHQQRAITNDDIVVLGEVSTVGDNQQYKVVKAYHGAEQETGQAITDLSLEVVV